MSSKGRARKKHSNKDKNKQMRKSDHNPDHNYYETIIVALNRCLSELRSEFQKENDLNTVLKESVHTSESNHFSADEHLRRVVNTQDQRIAKVGEELKCLMLDQHEENVEIKRRSKELDVQFTQLKDDLLFERQLLTYRIHSWEEYHVQMVGYASKFETMLMRGMERDPKYKRHIIKLKKQRIEDWRNRYFDARDAIAQFKEDYSSCADVRFAAYVTHLIQKNSESRKEFEELTHSVFLIVLNLRTRRANLEPLTVKFELERELKSYLKAVTKQQNELIHQIVDNYHKLKAKYVDAIRHKNLYTTVLQGKPTIFPNVHWKQTMRKIRILEDSVDFYKREVNCMWLRQEEQEVEIRHLRKTIYRYEYAVQMTMESLRDLIKREYIVYEKPDQYDQVYEQCSEFITELISMLSCHERSLLPTPSQCSISSVYQQGDMGIFIRPSSHSHRSIARSSVRSSCRELFRTQLKEQFERTIKDDNIECSIIDVKMGSNLYITSSTSLNLKANQIVDQNYSFTDEVLNFSPTISSTSGLTICSSSVVYNQESTIVPIENYNIK